MKTGKNDDVMTAEDIVSGIKAKDIELKIGQIKLLIQEYEKRINHLKAQGMGLESELYKLRKKTRETS